MGVKFCPKCKSNNILLVAGGNVGMFECYKCKFRGSVFPERSKINPQKFSGIKAVVFDVGGVLSLSKNNPVVRISKTLKVQEQAIHETMAKKLGVSVDTWFDSIDTYYGEAFIGKISEKNFHDRIAKNLGVDKIKLEKLFIKTIAKYLKTNKKLYRYAYKIKKLGFKIGILSDNFCCGKKACINDKRVKPFDIRIFSCDVNMRKPNIKIYKLLIKKLGVKASEIVFIDNREFNLVPARKLGIKTVLFNNTEQAINDTNKLLRIKI